MQETRSRFNAMVEPALWMLSVYSATFSPGSKVPFGLAAPVLLPTFLRSCTAKGILALWGLAGGSRRERQALG